MNFDRFSQVPASAKLTLEQSLQRLRQHSDVKAVMFIGSTGTGEFTPHSDYDLLLILDDYPPGLGLEESIIDDRMADLVIVSAAHLTALGSDPEEFSDWDWALVRWLATGRPAYDPESLAEQAAEKATRLWDHRPATDEVTQRDTRMRITHDVRINRTYLHRIESDPIYRTALGMRQLHTFVAVVQAWFTARDLRPEGWKKNLAYLADNDPDFLQLVDRWLTTVDVRERHAIYETAVERALEPFGGPVPDGQVDPGTDAVWPRLVPG